MVTQLDNAPLYWQGKGRLRTSHMLPAICNYGIAGGFRAPLRLPGSGHLCEVANIFATRGLL